MRLIGLKKNLASSKSNLERLRLIDPTDRRISVRKQAELLDINRSSIYRKRLQKSDEDKDIQIMNMIDAIYTKYPYYGYRRITAELRLRGCLVNKKRTRRLMRKMGLYAIYPKLNLSKMYHAKYVRPYLLRNLVIDHPNQVWGVDITYIRMQKGFMYLFIIIDYYSRYIVDYELSTTLDKSIVLDCLRRAFRKVKPEIINSDQGSQFTNEDYINLLEENRIHISMDSKGRALDNIITERFFRSLKYENIYLTEYETPRALRKGIANYIEYYNNERVHQSLDYSTPIEFYQLMLVSDKAS